MHLPQLGDDRTLRPPGVILHVVTSAPRIYARAKRETAPGALFGLGRQDPVAGEADRLRPLEAGTDQNRFDLVQYPLASLEA